MDAALKARIIGTMRNVVVDIGLDMMTSTLYVNNVGKVSHL